MPGPTQPSTTPTQAQQPSGREVALEKIGEFDQPDYVAQPPGSTDLYVVERPGRIRIVRDGRTLDEPALDIADQVSDSGQEQGLLSVFPPDFQDSRLLYVYFTGNDQDQHVVEYRANDDGTPIREARVEVLGWRTSPPTTTAGFSSSARMGCSTSAPATAARSVAARTRSETVRTWLAARQDPPDRPAQRRRSVLGAGRQPLRRPPWARPEVCNYGLRNPWRFSFDRDTRALAIGDVGSSILEEIDYVPAERTCGNNFGWSAFEAELNEDQRAPNVVPPILVYGHGEGCSVTGGYVVRDPSLPSMTGRYVYGDFCAGELRSFRPTARRAVDDKPVGLEVSSLSSFGEDNEGHVYAVSLDGPVYRLVPEWAKAPPRRVFVGR